ncbi:MAG: DUF302 domain-containing protein [Chthonomonadaceae bacterium]|nr:DUF302 domain-containing protein [Chthonomonadaceae bacterium]
MSSPFVVRRTPKSIGEAFIDLRRSADAAKWGILGVHDFSEILASKGFQTAGSYKILQICAPAHASDMLAQDPLIGLCMPCNILVYSEAGQTKIAALALTYMLPNMFGNKAMLERAPEIEREVTAIIDAAV